MDIRVLYADGTERGTRTRSWRTSHIRLRCGPAIPTLCYAGHSKPPGHRDTMPLGFAEAFHPLRKAKVEKFPLAILTNHIPVIRGPPSGLCVFVVRSIRLSFRGFFWQ